MRRAAFVLVAALSIIGNGSARAAEQGGARPNRVAAVFELGDPAIRVDVATAVRGGGFAVLDSGLVDAAARGAGYTGSLNLSRDEARRLASTVGATTLVMGGASIRELESDNGKRAFDSVIAVLLIDGASGRLLRYRSFDGSGESRAASVASAFGSLDAEIATWLPLVDDVERRRESRASDLMWDPAAVDMLGSPEGGGGLVPPRFFKRPAPKYTDEAERLHVVATVDVVVQFNADGSYGPIDVVRWAGFGLEEAAIEAVRACTFWPARKDGKPITARALLRYNFRFRDR